MRKLPVIEEKGKTAADIEIPKEVKDLDLLPVVSVSGGKDSTALILLMRELGFECRYVFSDTGWETEEVYAYLLMLEEKLGIKIERIGVPGGMVAKIREFSGFPSRLSRWCTRILKVEPLMAYHRQLEKDTGRETVSVVGIRGDESEARAVMSIFEDDERWGGWVWRPIHDWTVTDVLLMHKRHGIPVNPLYQMGHDRVGCYPCVMANKEEIRNIARSSPERINLIRSLEVESQEARIRMNAESEAKYWEEYPETLAMVMPLAAAEGLPPGAYVRKYAMQERAAAKAAEKAAARSTVEAPGDGENEEEPPVGPWSKILKKMWRFAYPDAATFFQTMRRNDPRFRSMPIDTIVQWANTERGGHDVIDAPIFQSKDGGCFRWGLCSPPEKPVRKIKEKEVVLTPTTEDTANSLLGLHPVSLDGD